MALLARIKPRAERDIFKAAAWWLENRPAAPAALEADLGAALRLLVEQPGIGQRVEKAKKAGTRRLYLARTRYFIYYRVDGPYLDIVAFWHASRDREPAA